MIGSMVVKGGLQRSEVPFVMKMEKNKTEKNSNSFFRRNKKEKRRKRKTHKNA